MSLTGRTVRSALSAVGAVGSQLRSVDELAAGADDALRQAPGLTPQGAAAFLATCAVESAWFRTTVEYGSGQSYAPFIGRTFVQLTWRENYAGFGQWCAARGLIADPNQFVNNPTSLGDYRWAWLGAVYYFASHGLWDYANRGDFRAVSQGVNGGNGRIGTSFTPNSWAERQSMYRVFLNEGAALLPTGPAPTAAGPPLIAYYTEDMHMRVPAGGSDGTSVPWQLTASPLHENDLVIAPGNEKGVVLYNVYCWSMQDNTGTGGNPVPAGGQLVVWPRQGQSFRIPRGTTKIEIWYWSEQDFTASILPVP